MHLNVNKIDVITCFSKLIRHFTWLHLQLFLLKNLDKIV